MLDPLPPLAALLTDGGLDLFAVFPAAGWDAAEALLPGARSVVLVGSGGGALWQRFTAWLAAAPKERLTDEEHPLDRYVQTLLDAGDRVLAGAQVRSRRFEPTLRFTPRIDFRRLAALAGLGSESPLGMVVHPIYGPWWALRGAWLCDRALPSTAPMARPCDGCPAPCRPAIPPGTEGTLAAATRAAREACVLCAERYGDEQLTYHNSPDEGRARLAARLAAGPRTR